MKKKILLTLAVLASLFVLGTMNVSAGIYGDLTYEIENGEVTITDCNESATSVIIPVEIEGCPVTTIDSDAFYGCSITNIDIPNSVSNLGYGAFSHCESIESIKIPNSITNISNQAFIGCINLKNVEFSDGLKSIGNEAFYYCYNIINLKIPDSVDAIGSYAFGECYNLTSVNIPNGIKTISAGMFAHCYNLTSINIPDSVNLIEGFAFGDCHSLTNINIPKSVISIGDNVFYCCVSLENINVDENNQNYSSINGVLFDKEYKNLIRYPINKGGELYKIPDGVLNIAMGAFDGCIFLKSIELPKSVTLIDKSAFSDCMSLENVYYAGNEEEWNNISFGIFNEGLLNAKTIYNYKPASASAEITSASSTPTSLKFISTVITEGEPEIATFGTTFIPLWLFETGSTNVATVQYDNSKYDIQNGQTFGATLGGIPESAKDMAIVGKSFIKDADGNYTWSAAKSASVNNPTLNEVN